MSDETKPVTIYSWAGGMAWPVRVRDVISDGNTIRAFDDDGKELPVNLVKGPPPVSVKDFGAVGDGRADDTTAIQAAVDAHLATGTTASAARLTGRRNPLPPASWRPVQSAFASARAAVAALSQPLPGNVNLKIDMPDDWWPGAGFLVHDVKVTVRDGRVTVAVDGVVKIEAEEAKRS